MRQRDIGTQYFFYLNQILLSFNGYLLFLSLGKKEQYDSAC
jgi:hypothetical protein